MWLYLNVLPEAKILDCFLPSAMLISAALIPSDSRMAALFFLSASTCICMASWTRAGIRMSRISYRMQAIPQASEAWNDSNQIFINLMMFIQCENFGFDYETFVG